MKRFILLVSILFVSITLVSCNKKDNSNVIKVGYASAFSEPVLEILEAIKDDVKKDGYELEIIKINGYTPLNSALFEKSLDANFFQHQYFMEQFNIAHKANLVVAQRIYYPLFGLYANTDVYKNIDDVKEKVNSGEIVKIGVPNDFANLSRTYYLLKLAGLISIKDDKNTHITSNDVIKPSNLIFEEVQQDMLPQKFVDTNLAVMYPKDTKSNVINKDSLLEIFTEELDDVQKTYSINLAARNDNIDSDKIKVLIKHITSEKVRQIVNNYEGGIPAF